MITIASTNPPNSARIGNFWARSCMALSKIEYQQSAMIIPTKPAETLTRNLSAW